MIANGLTKALTSAKHKDFIEMICLEDQEKRLTSIKLQKDQQDVLLLYGAEQNSKAFEYGANMSWYVSR